MSNSGIWIFVFPAKEDSTDWEGITKKLVQKYLGTIHLTANIFESGPNNANQGSTEGRFLKLGRTY